MRLLLTIILTVLVVSGVEAETTVRIEGLQTLSEEEALGLMGGRLTFIRARPASASRADDAAFILETLLRARGFSQAEVDSRIESRDAILLTVKEGLPRRIGKVVVEGVEEELATKVKKQFRSAHAVNSRTLAEVPYLENRNAAGLKNAAQALHADGYWAAEVRLADASPGVEKGRIRVTLEVDRGAFFRLALPRVSTGEARQSAVEEQLKTFALEPATASRIREIRRIVEQYFRNQGYQFASVKMFAEQRDELLALTFKVDPGRQYVVGNIAVTGTEDVQKDEITERFREFRGDRYRAEDIEDEIRKLYATGAFSTVRIEEALRDDGTLDLTVVVEETKPDGYYYYGGIGSLEGPILGGGYYHRNLFGQLWNFSGGLEVSAIGGLGEVRVTEPRFLGEDISFTTRAYALTRLFDGYDRYEFGGGAEASWDRDDYTARLYLNSAFVTTNPNGLPRSALGPSDYFVNRLGIEQTLDKRNSSILPTDGYLLRLKNELGLTLGNNSASFFRTEGQASFFQPITEKGRVALNAKAGVVIPTADSSDLPIDLRYFNGGSSTMRGFPERELGPLVNSYPVGGEAFWVTNFEYLHKLTSLLEGIIFVDAGNLTPSFEDFGSGRTNYAVGAGIRLDLPIGPVRLEYGHNMNPGPSDPSGAFHFAIGASF